MAPQPTPQDWDRLIKALRGAATLSPTAGATSLPMGIPASGITATAGPEALFAAGLYDPTRLAALEQDMLNQLTLDYLREVRGLGGLPEPPKATVFSYQVNPTIANNPEITRVFNDLIIPRLSSGEYTAQEAKNALNEVAKDPAFSQATRNTISKARDVLASEVDNYVNEYVKAQRDRVAYEQSLTSGMANAEQIAAQAGLAKPTLETARLKLYSDLGMPQLAAAPSPTEQFDLPLELFTNQERVKDLAAQLNYGQAAQRTPYLQRLEASLGEQNRLAGSFQARANQEAARKYAEEMTKDYATGAKAGDIAKGTALAIGGAALSPFTFGLTGAGGIIGGIKSIGKAGERERSEKQAAYQQFYNQKLAELSAQPGVKPIKLIDISPEARKARRLEVRAQRFLRAELNRAQKEAEKASSELTALGITPYSQFTNQILLNAALQATKPKK